MVACLLLVSTSTWLCNDDEAVEKQGDRIQLLSASQVHLAHSLPAVCVVDNKA